MRISDWSSDVCSSDLRRSFFIPTGHTPALPAAKILQTPVKPIIGKFVGTIGQPVKGFRQPLETAHDRIAEISGRSNTRDNRGPHSTAMQLAGKTMSKRFRTINNQVAFPEIGNTSCRERVCQYV